MYHEHVAVEQGPIDADVHKARSTGRGRKSNGWSARRTKRKRIAKIAFHETSAEGKHLRAEISKHRAPTLPLDVCLRLGW